MGEISDQLMRAALDASPLGMVICERSARPITR